MVLDSSSNSARNIPMVCDDFDTLIGKFLNWLALMNLLAPFISLGPVINKQHMTFDDKTLTEECIISGRYSDIS